ncbi:MAG: Cellulose synthesis regulatory protein [Nocardioidaceae bacterium]|nr:Cellulose synthesis regulatory protein [Nocardioidaceae bacterium]
MPFLADVRREAYVQMEAAQSEQHLAARARLVELESGAARAEGALLAAIGIVLHDLVHSDAPSEVDHAIADLVKRADALDAPSLVAMTRGLRAVTAGMADDNAALIADTAAAQALVENDDLVAVDRCFVWMLCAAAYNAVNLWELADELYDRAILLGPVCEVPTQQSAAVVNQLLIRLGWAAALFELGRTGDALAQVRGAARAAEVALVTPGLPELWRLDARAGRDLTRFVERCFDDVPTDIDVELARLDARQAELQTHGDLEVLPFLDSFVALGLLRLGRADEARHRLARATARSSSDGADTFRAWVRTEALAPSRPDPALEASRAYGSLVREHAWNARIGMLAAARTMIAEERLAAEHAALSVAVQEDPLTGLHNRRSFDAWLNGEVLGPTALLIVDVDDFKQVNDRFGHVAGDEALRRIATTLARHARPGDTAARLGGDEFVLVIVGSDLETTGGTDPVAALHVAALDRAAQIRSAVTTAVWEDLGPDADVAVSIGVAAAMLGHDADGPTDLYRRADADLYAAKGIRTA